MPLGRLCHATRAVQASILRYSIDSVPAVGAGGASTTGGMMDLAALGIFSADGALQQGSNRSGVRAAGLPRLTR